MKTTVKSKKWSKIKTFKVKLNTEHSNDKITWINDNNKRIQTTMS